MTATVLNVPDISCGHCQNAITSALSRVEGVRRVDVDVEGKQVLVEYDETVVDLNRLKAVLQEEEYPVESVVS